MCVLAWESSWVCNDLMALLLVCITCASWTIVFVHISSITLKMYSFWAPWVAYLDYFTFLVEHTVISHLCLLLATGSQVPLFPHDWCITVNMHIPSPRVVGFTCLRLIIFSLKGLGFQNLTLPLGFSYQVGSWMGLTPKHYHLGVLLTLKIWGKDNWGFKTR